MTRSALALLLFLAGCNSSDKAALTPDHRAERAVPPAPAPRQSPPDAARAPSPAEPAPDYTSVAIRTRSLRLRDCDDPADVKHLSFKRGQNQLGISWRHSNYGEPFKARVSVTHGRIQIDVEDLNSAMEGMLCGAQVWDMATRLERLPAGRYLVVGPFSRRRVKVDGTPAPVAGGRSVKVQRMDHDVRRQRRRR